MADDEAKLDPTEESKNDTEPTPEPSVEDAKASPWAAFSFATRSDKHMMFWAILCCIGQGTAPVS